ncbi:MAG TPA: glycosyltransferase [Methanothermobacter sp.]|nr:MurG-related protein [Methanothermobacter sp. MT-2]HHW04413.1 glycosyltransferase [Methanothermobacter sp.]HOK72975.1 glycosyltransferase [Methanothermobacter sp.]HOL69281.1 glycosyltransferase [Methanothermobacter sp.]HPQ04499.1 glycosyltransferase [Methanothermobacter sp.]
MKVLFMITGRGMGGDAVMGLNIAQTLSNKGFECEFALDHKAPGLLFKKRNIRWYKTSIPQAGGHAATTLTLAKAALKAVKATWEGYKLIRKVKPDIIVGVIGGGAIIGCLSAKLARVPSVSISNTITDARVCRRLNPTIMLPESGLFGVKNMKNVYSSYSPINPNIVGGNAKHALEKMPSSFREDLPTILFSSGSSLFELMAKAAHKISESDIKANILVVGHPLKEDYERYLQSPRIINLGYIDWIPDLYRLVDLAVLSDDGVMIHEAIACKLPIVALKGVKYGRYHNMASVFPGAVVESDFNNLEDTLKKSLMIRDEMREKASVYSEKVIRASDKIADIIVRVAKRKI